MLRMEIALIIILGFIAYMYFSAERKHTKLHRTFSVLLLVVIVHLVFDAVTIYTVNHLEQVPIAVNDAFHRVFVGTMAGVLYLFYRYIAAVVEEETKKKMIFDWPAKIFLIVLEIIALVFPIAYIQTPNGNYSAGAYVIASYGGVAIYLALCAGILIWNWKQIHVKKKFAIGVALWVEFLVCGLQGAYPTWLISGMGITLMTLSFYLTLENPDILRAELTEQKMSMLYLKSQVNPHFLYNTLDCISSLASLGKTTEITSIVPKLANIMRMSIKGPDLLLISEDLNYVREYLDIQKMRFQDRLLFLIECSDSMENLYIPKLIIQPVVENAIIHGISESTENGLLSIQLFAVEKDILIKIYNTGPLFSDEVMKKIHGISRTSFSDQKSIGLMNIQMRLKSQFGNAYGLLLENMEDQTSVCVTIRIPQIHSREDMTK